MLTMPALDPVDSQAAIIDKDLILERFEGDVELLREVVALFLEDCPRRLSDMREALARRDGDGLQRAAHSIKGSVGNFAAKAAVEAALRLEVMGRSGDLTDAEAACGALEREIARLTDALASFV